MALCDADGNGCGLFYFLILWRGPFFFSVCVYRPSTHLHPARNTQFSDSVHFGSGLTRDSCDITGTATLRPPMRDCANGREASEAQVDQAVNHS